MPKERDVGRDVAGAAGRIGRTAGRLRNLLAALFAAWLVCAPARADVVQRAPWHPIAAAYLYGLFATTLAPVDWTGIDERYRSTSTKFVDQGDRSVLAMLRPVGLFAGADLAAAIERAVAGRSVDEFRAVTLRATSLAVRYHLSHARRRLERPRGGLGATMQAQGIYRAFAGYLKESDPAAFRRLGLAWLELTTIAGAATNKASRAAFADRAWTIESYLIESFEKQTPNLARRGRPWLPPDADLADQAPLPRLVLNFEQRGVDERKLFLVSYGDMLFDSPEIYGETARGVGLSCAGCHNRGDVNRRFFIPGLSRHRGGLDVDSALFNPRGNDHRFDPVDIPSLRGIRYTAPYGRDGRIASLREFTRNVIVGEFGGPEPTPMMLDALIAYLNEFDFLPAPYLARDGRLNATAPVAARRGEALFFKRFAAMGGRSCESCHTADGNFLDGRRHDIGSSEPATTYARDGAFDTPTLLGVAYSAPYFHDGSLATLADVVDWFDRRYRLDLGQQGTADLTAYLKAVGAGEDPYEKFDGRNTPFRLAFDELSTFLTTLDTLIPARDRFHARLVIRSVARDLRADTGGMANFRRAPWVHELAGRLDAIGGAVRGADWDRAARLWAQYKSLEKTYGPQLY